jgi:hypothetical protein
MHAVGAGFAILLPTRSHAPGPYVERDFIPELHGLHIRAIHFFCWVGRLAGLSNVVPEALAHLANRPHIDDPSANAGAIADHLIIPRGRALRKFISHFTVSFCLVGWCSFKFTKIRPLGAAQALSLEAVSAPF